LGLCRKMGRAIKQSWGIMDSAITFKKDRMKRTLIIVIVACSLMALSLFFIRTFVKNGSQGPATAKLTGPEQALQSQINTLSGQISSLNSAVSQLQSQAKTVSTQTGSQLGQQVSSKIDTMSLETTQLTNKVHSLEAQMATMQEQLRTSGTSIGITPVNINGLSVSFITDNFNLGMTGSANPNAGQFAIKIANTTSSVFTNVDITGTITSSESLSEALASGYPQLVDGSALCSYVYYMTQDRILNFEAFGGGKASLSIPAKGSVTIRPKITLLAGAGQHFPAAAFNIALNTITYDTVVSK
jgi:chaperonin cofactor prefoldin